jgi:hypothetical protein
MAKWQRTIKLNPEWDQCSDDEITRQELAASIARKLSALRPLAHEWAEETRLELAETFEDMSRDETLSEDEFNGMMNDLYDWGDTSLDSHWNGAKPCWIDCMTPVP